MSVAASVKVLANSRVTAFEPAASVRLAGLVVTLGGRLRSATATSSPSTAPGAITMPAPLSRSVPTASMSRTAVVAVIAVRELRQGYLLRAPGSLDHQGREGRCVWSRSRCAAERREAGRRGRHTRGGREVGLLQDLSTGGREVPCRDRRTVRLEEDSARPVRTVRSDRLRPGEDTAGAARGPHINLTNTHRVLRRRVPPRVAGG